MNRTLERAWQAAKYRQRRLAIAAWTVKLHFQSRLGTHRITAAEGPVVSLTSHGARISRCHIAIESIARGNTRPGRLILWLDDERALQRLPKALWRQTRRGLEIRLSPNLGPHTKYYTYVQQYASFSGFLVTADDDVLYPTHWLEGLVAAAQHSPECIIAFRARRITMDDKGQFRPYAEWPFSSDPMASFANFGTGHSGVLYPPQMQLALRERGDHFLEVCPRADDVWLHNTAVEAGVRTRLVDDKSNAFDTLPFSQRDALKHTNVTSGHNDAQISATYSPESIEKVRADAHSRFNR